jgi:hypothetical protein
MVADPEKSKDLVQVPLVGKPSLNQMPLVGEPLKNGSPWPKAAKNTRL